jgi:hypothetical protein
MLVAWIIEMTDHGVGYQVMDENLVLRGLYDVDGKEIDNPGDYTTVDSGADPMVGVPLPKKWAAKLGG